MVPIFVFVAGVTVGVGACKLYDFLKNKLNNAGNVREFPQSGSNKNRPVVQSVLPVQSTESRSAGITDVDISPLEPIMRNYGVDISAPNCLYILCNLIKSNTYKKLLDDIIGNTRTGEELISYINKVDIETFTYPNSSAVAGKYFVPVSTIDQLLSSSKLVCDTSDPKKKVEILINSAYASAINRLKNNFGIEFGKLIKAYEEGRELQSYYNDLINEIKVSRDFMST